MASARPALGAEAVDARQHRVFPAVMTIVSRSRSSPHTLSLPNLLTFGRIAAIPAVVGCMFWSQVLQGGIWLRWAALFIFIAAAITDALDGYVARMWAQTSPLGRM